MELQGKVFAVLPPQSGTSARGDWKRQTVVFSVNDGKFETKIAVENVKKADEFGALKVGDEVKFRFDVSSREYQGKWFTSATCWYWEVISTANTATEEDF